jgi:uncharacterized protein YwqG
MGIISAFRDIFGRDRRPKSFMKGEKFENCTESFFPESHYALVERTVDFKTNNKRFVESSLKPDFKFRDRRTNNEFYIESKYRSDLFKGKLEWCKDISQWKRYQDFDRMTPVFILIGLYGRPSSPDHIYLIPLNKIKYTGLYPSTIQDYELVIRGRVPSRELWNR